MYSLRFLSHEHIKVEEGYKVIGHGNYIHLFLTEDEADKISKINMNITYKNRTMYVAKDHMMHEIYKVLPELFEE